VGLTLAEGKDFPLRRLRHAANPTARSLCLRFESDSNGWRLWTETAGFVFGTYFELHDNGRIVWFVVRDGEVTRSIKCVRQLLKYVGD
jgi:hypothetical protein